MATNRSVCIYILRKVKTSNQPASSVHQVLLMKRARTDTQWPDCWGPIISPVQSFDENCRDVAIRAVREKTGYIFGTDVIFVRHGGLPMSVEGGEMTTFLFRLVANKNIALSPGHSVFMWTSPQEVLMSHADVLIVNGDMCSPQASELLARVYLSSLLEDFVDWLGRKRTQGAAEIAKMTLVKFEKVVQDLATAPPNTDPVFSALSPKVLVNLLVHSLDHVANSRPSIAPLRNVCDYLMDNLRLLMKNEGWQDSVVTSGESTDSEVEEREKLNILTKILTFFSEYQSWRSEAFLRLVHNSQIVMNGVDSLFTMARSSVIETALIDTAKRRHAEGRRPVKVTVAESRPLLEGTLMASELLSAPNGSIQITLVTDAQACIFGQLADCVILGADAVFPDGSCMNKVGGFAAVMSAYHAQPHRKSVYIACTSDKFLTHSQLRKMRHIEAHQNSFLDHYKGEGADASELSAEEELERFLARRAYGDIDHRAPAGFQIEEKEGDEIYSIEVSKPNHPITKVLHSEYATIRNVYFEAIPAFFITAYITEKGLIAPQDVGEAFVEGQII